MRPQELKAVRQSKGWGQTQAAARVHVSQAYLNMLENGKRRLTPKMARKFARAYDLSLPVNETFAPKPVDDQRLTESLARLGYPGFAYLRTHASKKNPSEVLLTALAQEKLDARVAEALPWLALQYWKGSSNWLVEQARKFNLQNRLGFVVTLARKVSERNPQNVSRTVALRNLENTLDESRLVKEDAFYRAPKTPGERSWLLENRPEEAKHWNLLTDLQAEHLQYAS